jgi:hypothetical protein
VLWMLGEGPPGTVHVPGRRDYQGHGALQDAAGCPGPLDR